MNRVQRSYDAVAATYAAEISSELAVKPLDRALLQAFAELAKGGLVADIGCGPGHVSAFLAGLELQTIGADLSPEMCSLALRETGLQTIVADMTSLPLRSASLSGIACMYAVIHLGARDRGTAYSEFARVVRPGGPVLVAFHVSDDQTPPGGTRTLTTWWGRDVELRFHFLDPVVEMSRMAAAGLEFVARLDRAPHRDVEHPSMRSYLLMRGPFPPDDS